MRLTLISLSKCAIKSFSKWCWSKIRKNTTFSIFSLFCYRMTDVTIIETSTNEEALELDHDYCNVTIAYIIQQDEENETAPEYNSLREFAKCDACRKSRTKVTLPNSLLNLTSSKDDGRTCDFCGDTMEESIVGKQKPPSQEQSEKKRIYVKCSKCEKIVLKESLTKHIQDIHDQTNKLKCHLCDKILSGTFSLKV